MSNGIRQTQAGVVQTDSGVVQTAISSASALAWETAADWDSATSASGVIHESFGDLPGASVVQLGWPSVDRNGSSLSAYWTFSEDSGSPTADHTGNGNDGVVNGPTQGVSGTLMGTTFSWDGNDDEVSIPDSGDIQPDKELTIAGWVKIDDSNPRWWLSRRSDSGGPTATYRLHQTNDPRIAFSLNTGSSFGGWQDVAGTSNTQLPTATWVFYALTVDFNRGTEGEFYYNGSPDGNFTIQGGSFDQDNVDLDFGADVDTSPRDYFKGKFGPHRMYLRALSDRAIQALYDSFVSGSLTTAAKSFNTSTQPNLQNLSYSLNGQSIDLDVIGSPGTASEEVVTQSLGGATSHTLTWSNSHTDFRVRLNLSTSDVTTTPTFSRVSLN